VLALTHTMTNTRLKLLVLLFCSVIPCAVGAEEQQVGRTTSTALPGLHRLGLAGPGTRGIGLAGAAGYGFTESVLGGDDAHHRFSGSLAASYTPLTWLGLALQGAGRVDYHTGTDEDGNAASGVATLGEPRFFLRGGHLLGGGVSLGGEIALWLPAADSSTNAFKAITTDFRLQASWQLPWAPVTLVALGGYRLDRSDMSINQQEEFEIESDRVALGINEADSVLLGFGISGRLGDFELLGEWSGDLLVGSGVPENQVALSPMRLAAGGRWWAPHDLQVSLIVETSLNSARPDVGPDETLVAIEPRVTVIAGVTWHYTVPRPRAVDTTDQSEPVVRGQVTDGQGQGLAGVEVTIGDQWQTVTDSQGRYELRDVAPGTQEISISVNGWEPHSGSLQLTLGQELEYDAVLEPQRGEVRGRVTAPDGSPLSEAQVSIPAMPQTSSVVTDGEGQFVMTDLPPGPVELSVMAPGRERQTAEVVVRSGGVAEVTIQMDRALPPGQIRGTVQVLRGTRPRAHVVIEPGNIELDTDSRGRFSVDVPPGEYDITVSAPDFVDAHEHVVVEQNGVTVVIVTMRR
jgi:hypothetical protein